MAQRPSVILSARKPATARTRPQPASPASANPMLPRVRRAQIAPTAFSTATRRRFARASSRTARHVTVTRLARRACATTTPAAHNPPQRALKRATAQINHRRVSPASACPIQRRATSAPTVWTAPFFVPPTMSAVESFRQAQHVTAPARVCPAFATRCAVPMLVAYVATAPLVRVSQCPRELIQTMSVPTRHAVER